MTTYVHTHTASGSAGAASPASRNRDGSGVVPPARKRLDGGKGLAAMLLAAIVSAMLVVADQLMSTWVQGHLLAAWVALWAVGFAALALLAGTVRRFSSKVMADLDAWSARVAQRRADERLWLIARQDSRVMADLQSAMSRDEESLPAAAVVKQARSPRRRFTERTVPVTVSFPYL